AEGQPDVLVERPHLFLAALERLPQALLLVAHGLEPGALPGQVDLGLAHVLLQEERTLLERFDHAVRVGAHEDRDPVEQLDGHRRLVPPFLLPARRASSASASLFLLSAPCFSAWPTPSNAALTSSSSASATPICAATGGDWTRWFIAPASSLNWRSRARASSRRPAFTSRATSSFILLYESTTIERVHAGTSMLE